MILLVQEADQLLLIREFMLKLTPVITRETLRNTEAQSPAENAKTCLNWAMHLASQFASCYDQFHAAENTPLAPDAIAKKLKAAKDSTPGI